MVLSCYVSCLFSFCFRIDWFVLRFMNLMFVCLLLYLVLLLGFGLLWIQVYCVLYDLMLVLFWSGFDIRLACGFVGVGCGYDYVMLCLGL